jgi:hypothetical protein
MLFKICHAALPNSLYLDMVKKTPNVMMMCVDYKLVFYVYIKCGKVSAARCDGYIQSWRVIGNNGVQNNITYKIMTVIVLKIWSLSPTTTNYWFELPTGKKSLHCEVGSTPIRICDETVCKAGSGCVSVINIRVLCRCQLVIKDILGKNMLRAVSWWPSVLLNSAMSAHETVTCAHAVVDELV